MINFNPQISAYNKIGFSQQKQYTPAFGKSLEKDTFVKSSNPVSFGSSLPMRKKLEMFQNDIEKYVLKNPKIDLTEIEKIVQKYSPTTTVKSFDDLPNGSNAIATTAAYHQNQIGFTNDSEAIAQDKIIFIRPLNSQDKASKLFFLDCIEHEFTHILQEESKDRTSKVDFLNEYLKGKDFRDKKVFNTISLSPKVFSSVEHYVYLPLRKAMKKSSNLLEKLPFFSKDLLDNIYISQTGMKTEDYIKQVINVILSEAQNQCDNFDQNQVVKYIGLIAEKEKEAYTLSTEMLKKHMGINGPVDLDLRDQLYQIFEQTAKSLAV